MLAAFCTHVTDWQATKGPAAEYPPSGSKAESNTVNAAPPSVEDGNIKDKLTKEQCAHIGHRSQDIDPIILEKAALRHLDKVCSVTALSGESKCK